MTDRLEDILETHLDHLRKVNALMANGVISTRMNGKDTTATTITENAVQISRLEEALANHKLRKG